MQQENFLPEATLAKIRMSTIQYLISCMNAALGHSSTLSLSEASPFTPVPQPKILLIYKLLGTLVSQQPRRFYKQMCLSNLVLNL